MAFKTITITENAYAAIKRMKKSDESFSELFNRIAPKQVTVDDIFGTWKMSDKEFAQLKKTIAENRKQMNKDFEERHKKFFGDKR
jgi:predicted CopG family antitoxin